MSHKKIDAVKSDGWFKKWDILVYAVIVALAVALILAFTLTRDNSRLTGFCISRGSEKLYVYDFSTGEDTTYSDCVEIVSENDGVIKIRIYTDDGRGYNDVVADVGERKVSVVASNCSAHRDCVYTRAIDSNGSTPIVCTPHSLTVAPLVFFDDGNINVS